MTVTLSGGHQKKIKLSRYIGSGVLVVPAGDTGWRENASAGASISSCHDEVNALSVEGGGGGGSGGWGGGWGEGGGRVEVEVVGVGVGVGRGCGHFEENYPSLMAVLTLVSRMYVDTHMKLNIIYLKYCTHLCPIYMPHI